MSREKICSLCSVEFSVKPSHFKRRIYCSRKCHSKSKEKRKIRGCETCGTEFKYSAEYNPDRRYCSHKCRPNFGNSKRPVCPQCKNEHRKYTKYCSAQCYYKSLEGTKKESFYDVATEEEKIKRLKDSFERYVLRKEDGCWDWKGSKSKKYGSLQYGGKYKSISAHQASWIIHNGPIPKGMFICHHCDNPRCTRPDHLFIGSPQDNVLDMINKGRNVTLCGEAAPGSKLLEKEVILIKYMLDNGTSLTDIAKEFNVHIATIWDIKHKRTWRHI